MFLIPNENICRDEFGMLEMVVLILYNIKLGSACETSKRKAKSVAFRLELFLLWAFLCSMRKC